MYERSNFVDESPINFDHQKLIYFPVYSALAIDLLNKITHVDTTPLPIHSHVTSFHNPTPCSKPIISVSTSSCARNIICPINSRTICFPYMDLFLSYHTSHFEFHVRIAEWLENSYFKIFP